MAERKAVNKYYPPDWDPRKGSVNKRVGQHPLRDRAKKLGQGILVIRFELPYNIWCGGCGNHVGMGVRYNAEKSKVGNYYTTPIYKFRMKCHLCDNYFEIQTDPKNHDYVILCGARRKEQRWDPFENEQIVPEDKATHKKMTMDAMYKLEHGSDDVQKGKDKKQNLAHLESSRLSMRDDYMLNRMARDKFRAEKKEIKAEAEADQAILDRGALDIELVDETDEDRKLATLLKYSVTSSFEEKQKEKRRSIEQRPLFDASASATPTATPLSSSGSSTSSSSSDSKTPNDHQRMRSKLGQIIKSSDRDPFKIIKSPKDALKDTHANLLSRGIRTKPGNIHISMKSDSMKSPLVLNQKKVLTKAVKMKEIKVVAKKDTLNASDVLKVPSSNMLQKTPCSRTASEERVISGSSQCLTSSDVSTETTSCSVKDVTVCASFDSSSKSPSCDISSASQQHDSCEDATIITASTSSPLKNSSLVSLMENYDEGVTSDSSEES